MLYEFYTQGYDNTAYQFGYIPEFEGVETINAYCLGLTDGKEGNKKDFEAFDNFFKNLTTVKAV